MTQKEASFIKNAMENDGEEAEIIMDYKSIIANKRTIAVKVDHVGLLIPALVAQCKGMGQDGMADSIPDFNTLGQDSFGSGLILF